MFFRNSYVLFRLIIGGEPANVADEECFNLYVVLRVISYLYKQDWPKAVQGNELKIPG